MSHSLGIGVGTGLVWLKLCNSRMRSTYDNWLIYIPFLDRFNSHPVNFCNILSILTLNVWLNFCLNPLFNFWVLDANATSSTPVITMMKCYHRLLGIRIVDLGLISWNPKRFVRCEWVNPRFHQPVLHHKLIFGADKQIWGVVACVKNLLVVS